jgi:hypothetical protein
MPQRRTERRYFISLCGLAQSLCEDLAGTPAVEPGSGESPPSVRRKTIKNNELNAMSDDVVITGGMKVSAH